ncbi:MAG: single-stranded DNA-binding protein [Syntrophobacteraceae bacterium]
MAKGTVNKVILVGRLGADPDIRYSPNGVAVAKFNLATNDYVSAGTEGNREERTEWHRIVTFGKTAEFCGNYLAKGRQVYIEGSIRTNQWDDPQGQKRYFTEIIAREIQLLGSGEGQGHGQSQGQGQGQSQSQGQGQGPSGGQDQTRNAGPAGRSPMEELPANTGGPDDDIPF